MSFDRSTQDIGNVLHLEHVNLRVPDQLLATQFYVSALGLTRDPYLMTGVTNMWVNAGRTQFHLPEGAAQRLRGSISVVIPGRDALLARLRQASEPLAHTGFGFEAHPGFVEARCPWGNRLLCFEPDAARFGATPLGIVRLEFDVPVGSAAGIARFYRQVFGAPVNVASDAAGALAAQVQVGAWQHLVFRESAQPQAPYDGHHIQIYIADFSGPHRRLLALGAITEESDDHQYRLLDIVDPQTGAPLFRLEHEVRSITHPLFGRPLVNRNPAQHNRDYQPGRDAFVPGVVDGA